MFLFWTFGDTPRVQRESGQRHSHLPWVQNLQIANSLGCRKKNFSSGQQ